MNKYRLLKVLLAMILLITMQGEGAQGVKSRDTVQSYADMNTYWYTYDGDNKVFKLSGNDGKIPYYDTYGGYYLLEEVDGENLTTIKVFELVYWYYGDKKDLERFDASQAENSSGIKAVELTFSKDIQEEYQELCVSYARADKKSDGYTKVEKNQNEGSYIIPVDDACKSLFLRIDEGPDIDDNKILWAKYLERKDDGSFPALTLTLNKDFESGKKDGSDTNSATAIDVELVTEDLTYNGDAQALLTLEAGGEDEPQLEYKINSEKNWQSVTWEEADGKYHSSIKKTNAGDYYIEVRGKDGANVEFKADEAEEITLDNITECRVKKSIGKYPVKLSVSAKPAREYVYSGEKQDLKLIWNLEMDKTYDSKDEVPGSVDIEQFLEEALKDIYTSNEYSTEGKDAGDYMVKGSIPEDEVQKTIDEKLKETLKNYSFEWTPLGEQTVTIQKRSITVSVNTEKLEGSKDWKREKKYETGKTQEWSYNYEFILYSDTDSQSESDEFEITKLPGFKSGYASIKGEIKGIGNDSLYIQFSKDEKDEDLKKFLSNYDFGEMEDGDRIKTDVEITVNKEIDANTVKIKSKKINFSEMKQNVVIEWGDLGGFDEPKYTLEYLYQDGKYDSLEEVREAIAKDNYQFNANGKIEISAIVSIDDDFPYIFSGDNSKVKELRLEIVDDRGIIADIGFNNGNEWVADGKPAGTEPHEIIILDNEKNRVYAREKNEYYSAEGEELEEAPSAPGKYVLKIKLEPSDKFMSTEKSVEFEILQPSVSVKLDKGKESITTEKEVHIKGTVTAKLPSNAKLDDAITLSCSYNGDTQVEYKDLMWGDFERQQDGLEQSRKFDIAFDAFEKPGELTIQAEYGNASFGSVKVEIVEKRKPYIKREGDGWIEDENGKYYYVYDGEDANNSAHKVVWGVTTEPENEKPGDLGLAVTKDGKTIANPENLERIIDAGIYTITASLIDESNQELMEETMTFEIRPQELNEDKVGDLHDGDDYESKVTNYEGGKLTVELTGKGNYTGSFERELDCSAKIISDALQKDEGKVEVGPDGKLQIKGAIQIEVKDDLISEDMVKLVVKTDGAEDRIIDTAKDEDKAGRLFVFDETVDVLDGQEMLLEPVLVIGEYKAQLTEPIKCTVWEFDRKNVILYGALAAVALIGMVAMLIISLKLKRKMNVERLKLLELQENTWRSQRTISNSRDDV